MQLEAVAARAGLRVNELARRLTRRGKHRLVIETTQRHDPAFIAQIRALGVNLNQLTMRSQRRGFVCPRVCKLAPTMRNCLNLGRIEGREPGVRIPLSPPF